MSKYRYFFSERKEKENLFWDWNEKGQTQ